jgi:hypothetical protein
MEGRLAELIHKCRVSKSESTIALSEAQQAEDEIECILMCMCKPYKAMHDRIEELNKPAHYADISMYTMIEKQTIRDCKKDLRKWLLDVGDVL